jgi:hypothetical protein
MTQTTPNLITPYPETTDLADVSKNLGDIAISWETSFGAVWQPWTVTMVQGATAGGELAVITQDAASVARVFKTGKTVYAMAHLIVGTGTGLIGFLMFSLPYPVADDSEPTGVITSKYGASNLNRSGAMPPINYATVDPSAWVFEDIGVPQNRVTGDWAGLLLRYETV